MGEGSLSQEEIDALLSGADDNIQESSFPSSAMGSDSGSGMSPVDREILSDIFGGAYSMASSALMTLLSKNVKITNFTTESKKSGDVSKEVGNNAICMYSSYVGSLSGKVILIFSMDTASKILSLMMGGMSTGAMDANQIQTLKNGMAPFFGMVTLQVGMKFGGGINNTPVDMRIIKSPNDLVLPDGNQLLKMSMSLEIEGLPNQKLYFIFSQTTGEDILNLMKKGSSTSRTMSQNMQMDMSQGNVGGMNVNLGGMPQHQMSVSQPLGPQVGIKGVNFPSLQNVNTPQSGGNLNLLMDVQMSLTVELGRTKMYIKDILGLGEGSIIELDKLAGEPVDLLVNGKLIAKGEVVVIDENFGVRVTDIVSPTDRIRSEK